MHAIVQTPGNNPFDPANNQALLNPSSPQGHSFLDKMQQLGDLDLTAAVRQALAEAGASEQNLQAYDSHPNIQQSIGKAPDVQMYHQKEFWNYQLLALQQFAGLNTFEDRLLLQRFLDTTSWLTYFTNNVIDLAGQYDMPQRHGW